MEEIWKDIKGYEGYYQCSNLGRIRTLDRVIIRKDGRKDTKRGKILKFRTNPNGYYQVSLWKNNLRKMLYVHKLVAETFIENPLNLKLVNHKDEDKTNNATTNLEWETSSGNNIKYYQNHVSKSKGQKYKRNKIAIIDITTNLVMIYSSKAEAARTINLSPTQFDRYINSGKSWKGKYVFKSINDKCVEDIEKIS